ncbi:DUF2939 domain-containing protein [Novosphingobium sp.]|uniref:DUF2939 domain-containing protein n=1 Tax=Novosphingobium sp. TaxID=1874826 RepID=UPI001DB074A9|nr:DUF2939 domain-containing protein [Novosphingobium sp.]MBX9661909.1 DUF2939 domain-containing protein [Novosphingobium sp.]
MRKVLIVLAAVVLVVGLWFYASPSLALNGLKEAALAGDRDALEQKVDFPSVRDSLKSQFKAKMVAEMAKDENAENGFATLGMMIGFAMVDQMIDGIVSPDGMKAMIRNGRFTKPGEAGAEPAKPTEWIIERDGLDKFRARPKGEPADKVPMLVFKRDGLGWRLKSIDLVEGS